MMEENTRRKISWKEKLNWKNYGGMGVYKI